MRCVVRLFLVAAIVLCAAPSGVEAASPPKLVVTGTQVIDGGTYKSVTVGSGGKLTLTNATVVRGLRVKPGGAASLSGCVIGRGIVVTSATPCFDLPPPLGGPGAPLAGFLMDGCTVDRGVLVSSCDGAVVIGALAPNTVARSLVVTSCESVGVFQSEVTLDLKVRRCQGGTGAAVFANEVGRTCTSPATAAPTWSSP